MQILLFALALLHPVHETVTEIEWNAQSKKLEVAIRLHVLDEQWIRRQSDRDSDVSDCAIAYLRKHFLLNVDSKRDSNADAETKNGDSYRWIGRQEEGSHVWWYVEIDPRDKMPPKSLSNTMLFNHDTNYQHRILVHGTLPKVAMTHTIGKPTVEITIKAASSDD